MNITEITKRVINEFVGCRFFIINAAGELDRLNAFGEAHRWAFKSAMQANNVARRQSAFVFDKNFNRFI
jgi:hypothetical protein